MSVSDIPLDLRNPGQVFACLGLLEAADLLCGPAEGGFVWDWDRPRDPAARFQLAAAADDPVAEVLAFLAEAEVHPVAPEAWTSPKMPAEALRATGSPTPEPSDTALPICLRSPGGPEISLGHWADGSSRDDFKLYSGNRSAFGIAHTMLHGVVTGKKNNVQQRGLRHLFAADRAALSGDPLGPTVAMGGSFNFDARRAVSSLDTGYSPDAQDQKVHGSPVVEILAALGLEHARPETSATIPYRFGYRIWAERLPAVLARPALAHALPGIAGRQFAGTLALAGKNKIVEFAREETA